MDNIFGEMWFCQQALPEDLTLSVPFDIFFTDFAKLPDRNKYDRSDRGQKEENLNCCKFLTQKLDLRFAGNRWL